jgi:hypothetical protein
MTCARFLAAQIASELSLSFRPRNQKRAQGRPGAHRTHGSRATKKHAVEPQVQADHPAFLARWFYGLYVISPVTMLGCHRRPRDAGVFTTLAPASERQDHTTSPSAQAPLVAQGLRPAMCVHRIPLPTSVTIASRPSYGCETSESIVLICPTTQCRGRATLWRDGQISVSRVAIHGCRSSHLPQGAAVPRSHRLGVPTTQMKTAQASRTTPRRAPYFPDR